jgi:hypothetical protein
MSVSATSLPISQLFNNTSESGSSAKLPIDITAAEAFTKEIEATRAEDYAASEEKTTRPEYTQTADAIAGAQQQALTMFNTQRIGQETEDNPAALMTDEQSAKEAAAQHNQAMRDEFREYIEKNPIEHYFEKFLESLDITQEEFDALPPEEQSAIMDAFEDYLKEQMDLADGRGQGDEAEADAINMAVLNGVSEMAAGDLLLRADTSMS